MYNITIADTQQLFVSGLKMVVEERSDLHLISICDSEEALFNSLDSHQTDLLIVDNFKADFNLKKIKLNYPNVKLIVISLEYNTLTQNKLKILNIVKLGVDGFITKDCDDQEINDAITAVLQNDKFYCKKILNIIIEKGVVEEGCDAIKLSVRELEIVKLTVQGLTSKQVGEELYISYHTVNTHRKNIMKKLGFKSHTELVVYSMNTGLLE